MNVKATGKVVAKNLETLRIFKRFLSSEFNALLYAISPFLLAHFRYFKLTGKILNLKNPQSFDEKLLWLSLYWRHPLKSQCTDKYAVRSYVSQNGLGNLLPNLIGVYSRSSEIDFSTLPRQFVLKCTHGCKFNIICKDKDKLNIENTLSLLDKWMKINISNMWGEIHYEQIKPRIICEEFLDDLTGNLPVDYKLFCFSGIVHCTMACTERDLTGYGAKYHYYDRNWEKRLPYDRSTISTDKVLPKPASYREIIKAAEILSKPFPFVRVDLYDIQGKAVFGEMTFTPNGCIDTDTTAIGQQELGKLVSLPDKMI